MRGVVRVGVPDGGASSRALRVIASRYTQGEVVVRALDPALGGEPVSLTQRLDAHGGSLSLGGDATLLLGSEITQALELVPIGGCGVSDPTAERTTLVLGFTADSGVPREFDARCTRDPMDEPHRARLRCEATLDRPLEVANEARSQGITAVLEGRASLEATLDLETGLCPSATHHLEMTIVERMGSYEERESAIVELRTVLVEPAMAEPVRNEAGSQ